MRLLRSSKASASWQVVAMSDRERDLQAEIFAILIELKLSLDCFYRLLGRVENTLRMERVGQSVARDRSRSPPRDRSRPPPTTDDDVEKTMVTRPPPTTDDDVEETMVTGGNDIGR